MLEQSLVFTPGGALCGPRLSAPSRYSTDCIGRAFAFWYIIRSPGLRQHSVDSMAPRGFLRPKGRPPSSWNRTLKTRTSARDEPLQYLSSLAPSCSASKALAYSRGVKSPPRPAAPAPLAALIRSSIIGARRLSVPSSVFCLFPHARHGVARWGLPSVLKCACSCERLEVRQPCVVVPPAR